MKISYLAYQVAPFVAELEEMAVFHREMGLHQVPVWRSCQLSRQIVDQKVEVAVFGVLKMLFCRLLQLAGLVELVEQDDMEVSRGAFVGGYLPLIDSWEGQELLEAQKGEGDYSRKRSSADMTG
jgi:hypothetical protein